MEWSVLFLIFGWAWFVRGAGAVNIEHCGTGGFVDIVENAMTNITCSGLSETTNVTWSMLREGSLLHEIATCTPSNCTLLQPGQFEVQRSPGQSLLVYRQENRTADENAKVTCTNVFSNGEINEAFCKFHVISPAVLSGCVVEEDRDNGTVNGSCHFERAYSASKDFTCMWYQTPTDPDQTTTAYPGVILNKEEYSINGQVYERGQCILSIPGQRWDEANYTYSIDFYPGSGSVPVPIGSQDEPNSLAQEDDPLPIAAIVGGTVAGVVVVVVVAVVVAVVVVRGRRRQSRKPARSPPPPSATAPTDDADGGYNAAGSNPARRTAEMPTSGGATGDFAEAPYDVVDETKIAPRKNGRTRDGGRANGGYSEAYDFVSGLSSASSQHRGADKAATKVKVAERTPKPRPEGEAYAHLQWFPAGAKGPPPPTKPTRKAASADVYDRLNLGKAPLNQNSNESGGTSMTSSLEHNEC